MCDREGVRAGGLGMLGRDIQSGSSGDIYQSLWAPWSAFHYPDVSKSFGLHIQGMCNHSSLDRTPFIRLHNISVSNF